MHIAFAEHIRQVGSTLPSLGPKQSLPLSENVDLKNEKVPMQCYQLPRPIIVELIRRQIGPFQTVTWNTNQKHRFCTNHLNLEYFSLLQSTTVGAQSKCRAVSDASLV